MSVRNQLDQSEQNDESNTCPPGRPLPCSPWTTRERLGSRVGSIIGRGLDVRHTVRFAHRCGRRIGFFGDPSAENYRSEDSHWLRLLKPQAKIPPAGRWSWLAVHTLGRWNLSGRMPILEQFDGQRSGAGSAAAACTPSSSSQRW